MRKLRGIYKVNNTLYEGLMLAGLTGGLWLKLIYTQYSIKINKIPIFDEANTQMFFMTLLSSMVVMMSLALISHKRRLLLPCIGAAFFAFLILADTLYGRYYYNPVSMSILDQLYMAGDVSGSAMNLFKVKDVIFLMDFIVLMMFSYIVDIKGERIGSNKRAVIVGLILMVSVSLFTVQFFRTDRSHYIYEHKYIARDMGLLYYHAHDLSEHVERQLGTRALASDELSMVEQVNRYGSDNVYTGAAKDYNLVVIQLEAIMDFLVDYEVEGQRVMPYLSELKDQSLYMSNCYIQTANGNTVDAELMTNTSLLPSPTGAVYYEYPTNTYISLPKRLGEEGYSCTSYHAYEASFWNREVMHKTLGFDHFYSYDDFIMEQKVGWALGDDSFLRQSMDYTLAESDGRPFYSFMVALSSHHPFDAFITGPFSDAEGSEGLLNHYYNAGAYVDTVLEGFIQDLKDRGLYDNTVLVIYGDHGALFGDDAVKQSQVDGVSYDPYNWMKYQQIPVIIHAPGIFDEGLLVDGVTGQSDIMPTIANLFGLQDLYTLGADVLDEGYRGLVAKRYGDVITDDFIYISDESTIYDYDTGVVLDKAVHREDVLEVHRLLAVNDLIMISDYFAP